MINWLHNAAWWWLGSRMWRDAYEWECLWLRRKHRDLDRDVHLIVLDARVHRTRRVESIGFCVSIPFLLILLESESESGGGFLLVPLVMHLISFRSLVRWFVHFAFPLRIYKLCILFSYEMHLMKCSISHTLACTVHTAQCTPCGRVCVWTTVTRNNLCIR